MFKKLFLFFFFFLILLSVHFLLEFMVTSVSEVLLLLRVPGHIFVRYVDNQQPMDLV